MTFLWQQWFTCNGCALHFGSAVKLGYLARTLKSRNRAKSIKTFANVKLYHNLFDRCPTTEGLLRNRRRLAQCRCHEATLCHDLSRASYLWDMSDWFMEGWLRLISPYFEKEGSLDMSWIVLICLDGRWCKTWSYCNVCVCVEFKSYMATWWPNVGCKSWTKAQIASNHQTIKPTNVSPTHKLFISSCDRLVVDCHLSSAGSRPSFRVWVDQLFVDASYIHENAVGGRWTS